MRFWRRHLHNFMLLLLLACCWVPLPINADDGTDLRRSLKDRYAALNSAMERRDVTALFAILAPNFVSVDIEGHSETATQMIEKLKKIPPDANRSARTTLRSITKKGRTAVVEQLYEMKTTKTGDDGSTMNVGRTTVSEDTWVHSNGVWRLERTVTDQFDGFFDGQAVLHKTRQR